ncbi:hypothetical protein L198_04336 [Cryptococcus wingfieldii CBS 7118]|uniref:Phosphatidic acid phosphatase type 2/haloperoxidase domain-containing protein n=1 Tax=Cryptococcus wingfieldii CBS 7118 TaxID=1295528 RepID=A0A1E3J4C9_9TREE|nr:hypothetical protein L198_04336 [Cryptococcus wingfieldii CBS 7118]ODN95718.1 hypothetical protein L198_04336 [Cryptococcus wingfieldii CBS 7118]
MPPPASESALFQHTPDLSATLKREWEPGCQPDEVYEEYLPTWRAWMRNKLVDRLRRENVWMEEWQRRVRTERRDKFFYYSAVFGTHTFFMMFLPILFFFGRPWEARGLLYVVGTGIYVSSYVKDLVCTPRPYSPPVIRLSMSTHHHEYGFPSSHSTNSTSIALFFGQWLFNLRHDVGYLSVVVGWILLAIYAASVIGGRVYTGMHSTADIIGGSIMGIVCWVFWIVVREPFDRWIMTGSWTVPAVIVPFVLGLIHFHPEPMDDCPCFEDAIAVLSVILGCILVEWVPLGGVAPWLQATDPGAFYRYDIITQVLVGIARLVLGLGIMFTWRLIAKATLLRVLPPTFRAFSHILHTQLPTRRFYTAATDYKNVPRQAFRPIPSVLDLQSGTSSPAASSPTHSPLLTPQRVPSINGKGRSPSPMALSQANLRLRALRRESGGAVASNGEVREKPLKVRTMALKYDAEVLTKVGVYGGIGFMACGVIPYLFEIIEQSILG